MPRRYMRADPDVTQLAQGLVRDHHPELDGCEIALLFVVHEDDKGRLKMPKPNKHGKVVLSKAKAFTPADRCAGSPDFLIVLLYNWWENAPLADRTALVDHELMHCCVSIDAETPSFCVRPHDFEGFMDELQRYGPWANDLASAAEQLRLFEIGDALRQEKIGLELLDAATGS